MGAISSAISDEHPQVHLRGRLHSLTFGVEEGRGRSRRGRRGRMGRGRSSLGARLTSSPGGEEKQCQSSGG